MSTEWTTAASESVESSSVDRAARTREVLVVNRDPELRAMLGRVLFSAQLSSSVVTGEGEALTFLRKGPYGLVIVGIDSQESVDLVAKIHELGVEAPIVAVARTATPDLVRDVLHAGAADFFFGSLDARAFGARLVAIIEAAGTGGAAPESAPRGRSVARQPAASSSGAGAQQATPDPAGSSDGPDLTLTSTSKRMQRILEISGTIAPTDSTVLIQGESGTGKELLAKRIHQLSSRKDKPFVEVNCGALPENLLESQLFGHEKGSFTGAVHRQVGLFEIADQGTIFLDEVGEMGLDMQVKLLRVLQFREFRRIGGSQVVKVNVRVIAATNKDLKSEVEKKLFRSDLFYRLNVISLEVPPLRERVEEIPVLVETFATRVAKDRAMAPKSFSPEVMDQLRKYRWTGNVRELENAVERLILLTKSDSVTLKDLEEHLGSAADAAPVAEAPFLPSMTLDEVKRIHIANVLRENGGNKMRTARVLKINVKTLYNLMKRLEIPG